MHRIPGVFAANSASRPAVISCSNNGNDWIETGRSPLDVAGGGQGDDTIVGNGILRGEAGADRLDATDDAIVRDGSKTF